jgi:feruloyl esterase
MYFGCSLLIAIFWFAKPSLAEDFDDLGSISTDEIMTQLDKKFSSFSGGPKKGRKWGHHRKWGRPKPDDFEFLLGLEFEKVEATEELPAYYKIRGTLFPEIKFELWLPKREEWNKKFYLAGCGGFCGGVETGFPVGQFGNNIKWGIVNGYASATTDTGHDNLGNRSSYGLWALDNRQGEMDYAYRSIHEVSRVCKALIHLFYHRPPKYSYFAGCSNGGRQALMEAIRYPGDFDGLISGAPAPDQTGLIAIWQSWILQAIDGVTFTTDDITAIREAVLAQCDHLDGVVDGLISDPRRCPQIDFEDLDLSDKVKQLQALNQIYSKPVNTLGAVLYEGMMPYGSEIYWPIWIPGVAATPEIPIPFNRIVGIHVGNENYLKYMAFQEDNPDFEVNDFNFDSHRALLEFMSKIYNATDTNLRKFKKMGGKIIMYHGWADPVIPPIGTIAYYEAVVATMGGIEKTQDFFRLFLVPGMDHCSGANDIALRGFPVKSIGLDDFDALGALEKWVEKGIAPDEIMASGHSLEGEARSRPLFPYPLYARYIGVDPNDPDSFEAGNDGTVRWKRFRKDTFYVFEIPELSDYPFVEGEGVQHFYPYNHKFGLEKGEYDWRVWSPSMFDGVGYPGFSGAFEVE